MIFKQLNITVQVKKQIVYTLRNNLLLLGLKVEQS
jgi:hypothetical protein